MQLVAVLVAINGRNKRTQQTDSNKRTATNGQQINWIIVYSEGQLLVLTAEWQT